MHADFVAEWRDRLQDMAAQQAQQARPAAADGGPTGPAGPDALDAELQRLAEAALVQRYAFGFPGIQAPKVGLLATSMISQPGMHCFCRLGSYLQPAVLRVQPNFVLFCHFEQTQHGCFWLATHLGRC
jgi:hypothetical protein